jgi:hypothetical protein
VAQADSVDPNDQPTHGSDGNGYARLDGYLALIAGFFRNAFTVLKHALDDHTDDIADVLDRFTLRVAPRRSSLLLKLGAAGVPTRRIPIEIFVRFHGDFEGARFHSHYYGLDYVSLSVHAWSGETSNNHVDKRI